MTARYVSFSVWAVQYSFPHTLLPPFLYGRAGTGCSDYKMHVFVWTLVWYATISLEGWLMMEKFI